MFKKKKQRILDLAKVAIENRDKEIDKLKEENDIIKNNNTLILKQDRILKSIIREIKLVSESNTYSNDKVALRKIKELASTANQN